MNEMPKNLLEENELNSPSPSPKRMNGDPEIDSDLGVSLLTDRYNSQAKSVLAHYEHNASKKYSYHIP
jgi:hypothetical protein